MKLLVLTTNGKYYLKLTDDYSIHAFKTLENVVEIFNGFTKYYERGKEINGKEGQTWTGSATIAMANLSPKAIDVDFEATDLEKYILDMQPIHIWGGNIGKGYFGVEVNKTILDLPTTNIWKIILDKVYK